MQNHLIFFSILIACLLSCTPFSTRYDRIEPDKIRPLSIVYSPLPEGAPGDTVRLRLYAAGDSIIAASWQMTYDVVINNYGTTSAKNWRPLETVKIDSHLPDSMDVTFVVPESTFYKSQTIGQLLDQTRSKFPELAGFTQAQLADLIAIVAAGGTSGISLPDSLEELVVGLVPLFVIKAQIVGDLVAIDGKRLVAKSEFVIRYNSRFSTDTVLSELVKVNRNPQIKWMGICKVKGESILMFDPLDPQHKDRYTTQYLFNSLGTAQLNDTVEIDTGYSYFVVADSGYYRLPVNETGVLVDPLPVTYPASVFIKTSKVRVKYSVAPGDTVAIPAVMKRSGATTCYMTGDKRVLPATHFAGDTLIKIGPDDSVMIDTAVSPDGLPAPHAWLKVARTDFRMYLTDKDIGVVPGGSADMENYNYDWFYQNIDADSATLPLDSLFALLPLGREIQPILPSQDEKMHRARIWVVVFDQFIGEPNRPVGFAQVQSDVYFKYTDAYRDKMNSRNTKK